MKTKIYENSKIYDMREYFEDIFCEFINELKRTDLSERTLRELNDIFEKDRNIFFEKLDKLESEEKDYEENK